MSKSIVAPLVAVAVMALQLVFGVVIPEDVANQVTMAIVNVATIGLTIYGIFKNHTQA